MESIHIVGGAPRAGTTLLQAILADAKDAVPLLGESKFVRHILTAYREIETTWDDDAHYYFKSQAQAADIIGDAIAAVFRAVTANWGAGHFVTKSPEYSRYPAELRAVLPGAHTYAIMRDPKDIVALQLQALARETELGHRSSLFPNAPSEVISAAGSPDDLEATTRFLARLLLEYYPPLVMDDWTLVSYEALVRRPEDCVRRLEESSKLMITFDPNGWWKNVEFDYLRTSSTVERAWSSDLWGQPLSTSRIGVHRRILSDDQCALVDDECSVYLAAWRAETDLLSGLDEH